MTIYFIVTNDLSYDQRMIRIATSLSVAGYTIKLVGRNLKNSVPLLQQPFQQIRITCVFNKGKGFYIEYNIRVFFYLLFKKIDCICAIDLDTIIPCYFISKIKKVPRVYDAHELFCEMKEVVSRPKIHKLWKQVEKYSVPKFSNGYTVNRFIANEFNRMYNVNYDVVTNTSLKRDIEIPEKNEKYILYQGAVNEGRSFETLIPAMKYINAPLIICGDGNFIQQAKDLVGKNNLECKVSFKGYRIPKELQNFTLNAFIGLTLFEKKGLSNYYSLANRFFDYMHAGVPQLCSDFPVYREINDQFEIAILIQDLSPESIAYHINILLEDVTLYRRLQQNCMLARDTFNWQNEETKLIGFYKKLLG